MHFVSSLSDILSSYFVFVSCTFWNQYTDSIVKKPLHMCLFGAVSEFVKSELSELSVPFCQCFM